MTTPISESTQQTPRRQFTLPDPPESLRETMTSFRHLGDNGNAHHLIQHLDDRENTVFGSELFIASTPGAPARMRRVPDLLIAFDADPELYRQNNGYIISEQGKPPDFILEIASPSTRREDAGSKRDDYAAMGVVEYWRFDEAGLLPETRLAGDRLVAGEYQPIPIETLADGALQGYSPALNLFLRWEDGQLGWYDPKTGRHIPTFDDQRARAEQEHQARLAAEARVRELEEELTRRDEELDDE